MRVVEVPRDANPFSRAGTTPLPGGGRVTYQHDRGVLAAHRAPARGRGGPRRLGRLRGSVSGPRDPAARRRPRSRRTGGARPQRDDRLLEPARGDEGGVHRRLVEAVLLTVPGVTDAAVIAVPDPVMGEKVGAALVGGSGSGSGGIDLAEVIACCRERLADYKVPQFVTVTADPLPRNAGGKLLKARLRETVTWGPPLRR